MTPGLDRALAELATTFVNQDPQRLAGSVGLFATVGQPLLGVRRKLVRVPRHWITWIGNGVGRVGAAEFAAKVRRRESVVGYWVVLDSPTSTERLARVGYDYVCLDAQHGLFGYSGTLAGLTAIDAGGRSVGLVRVGGNDPATIGRALDAGAAGVIVPLVNSAEEAARAVAAAKYPPAGIRSYGPGRSLAGVGRLPAEVNAAVTVLVMIETAEGLANVEAIAATPGLDGLYIGPTDLTIGLGGTALGDTSVADAFESALARVRRACEDSGIAAGLHTQSGEAAAKRISEGFTFVSVAGDLGHLEAAAQAHLAMARGQRGAF